MDIRTGRTYETLEAALAAGVPEYDIAHVTKQQGGRRDLTGPRVSFKGGPFKTRQYRRNGLGQLVRVK